ncbi:TIGR02221 family CRISPR-associated protein [Clostridium sp. D2Q-14]|uniref:TIGR02221 family CRISPR-associated protein n=1 Tax=Anaeromonas gelatinilytica TaxID=2683194 RepID=UPI00193B237E|nr:TIGR02221 family CRISPR-associated protein [Anaeromonas gelatinilytica]MBS4534142.1 TIGR02221 family CRISPR-associated protein [Anaeromonas gelatinilytica]
MAKILISPLGVGRKKEDRRYYSATYKFNENGKIYKTPFVASALAEENKVDKIFFIGTGKSMWEEVYYHFQEKINSNIDFNYWEQLGEEIERFDYKSEGYDEEILEKVNISINKYLKSFNFKSKDDSKCFLIKYGVDEKELFYNLDIFMMISNEIHPEDEVYLDITHSFRSIPLFLYLMLDFIRTLKTQEIHIKGVYYGMFEAKDDDGLVPIVDLKSLLEISRWIRGTNDFVNYGNGYLISELVEDKGIKKNIKNMTHAININYIFRIRKQINNLSEKLNKANLDDMGMFKYVSTTIREFIERFANIEKDYKFQLEMSKWFNENSRYSSAYICLIESIVTRLCDIYDLDSTNHEKRELAKSVMFNVKVIRENKRILKLKKEYKSVNRIRKRIAHAMPEGNKATYVDDIDNFNNYFETIISILDDKSIEEIPNKVSIEEIKRSYKKR